MFSEKVSCDGNDLQLMTGDVSPPPGKPKQVLCGTVLECLLSREPVTAAQDDTVPPPAHHEQQNARGYCISVARQHTTRWSLGLQAAGNTWNCSPPWPHLTRTQVGSRWGARVVLSKNRKGLKETSTTIFFKSLDKIFSLGPLWTDVL